MGWGAWVYFSTKFERRAGEFDLTQLERMEAASVIYDRDGKELGKIFIQNRNPVSLDKVSPTMVKAVIAAEDNKFYEHDGVDYMGVIRAAIANYRRGKISQGASTVTQQLARNSFELRERTYQRKLVEMFLAHRIEQKFSKDKIMELYLNRVYFGSGFYGVEAAARGYFGRSAKDLTTGQCATLAGLLRSPQLLSPWNNKEGATLARNFVLKRMKEQRLISGEEYKEQVGLPLYAMKRTNPFKVSYAIDYIRQQAVSALGYRRAMNGGFRIYTTLDSKLQRTAEQSVRESLLGVEKRPEVRTRHLRILQKVGPANRGRAQSRKHADQDARAQIYSGGGHGVGELHRRGFGHGRGEGFQAQRVQPRDDGSSPGWNGLRAVCVCRGL